ncbi:MAG TPA: histidine kinase [Geobacter sp.]|nr:histidine kinase [Geobacter sp.]
MKFADRVRIGSILSFSLLVFVAALLVWSSGALSEAGKNDILADDIQATTFKRAALRDEYYLHGSERARVQWFGLNAHIEKLLKEGRGRFKGEDRRALGNVHAGFDDSVLASRRLVRQLQSTRPGKTELAHHDEFSTLLYSQVMLKDSALQQAAAELQKTAHERFSTANHMTMRLTLLFVLITVVGTIANSSFLNSLLRRRLAMLNNGAAMISSGDFSYRMQSEGSDELAELGRSFNSVAEKVQDYTRQLQDKHDLLNELSSQVPGILFQARLSPEGEFSTPYVSRGASDIYQVEPGAIVQAPKSIFGAIAHADEQGILASFLHSAQTLRPWEHEYRITVPDGAMKWLRGQARPMKLADGGTLWHGFISDVTERKLAEQVMAGARQELEQKVLQRTARLSLANEHLTQEIEVRKKVEEELLAQQQKLQGIALDLSMAEERERDRIAGELHDQVGQRLILAKIKLDTLASHLPPGELDAEAGGIGTLIEQTLQDIRSLTFQIRPPLLASAGVEATLRWLGEELRADFGLEVSFSDDSAEKPLRYDVRSTVFQAVRELMLNVAKHAGTKRCQVGFSRVGNSIMITVEDDGVGLRTGPPEGSGTRSGGFGLFNVKQRIEYLGGSFVIEAKGAGGTRGVIKVPLEMAV